MFALTARVAPISTVFRDMSTLANAKTAVFGSIRVLPRDVLFFETLRR